MLRSVVSRVPRAVLRGPARVSLARAFSSAPPPPVDSERTLEGLVTVVPDATLSAVMDAAASEGGRLAADKAAAVAAGLPTGYGPVIGLTEILYQVEAATGAPWWTVIVGATVVTRAALLYPQGGVVRNNIVMANLKPEMERLGAAAKGKAQQAMVDMFKRHRVHPIKSLAGPLMQMPLFISLFFALRRLADFEPSLATGGAAWFYDLTVADPTYMLPVASALTMLASIEASSAEAPTPAWMKNMLRGMSVMSLAITYSFPAAVLVYWIPSNCMTIAQAFFFRSAAVKRYFDIPERVVHPGQAAAGPGLDKIFPFLKQAEPEPVAAEPRKLADGKVKKAKKVKKTQKKK